MPLDTQREQKLEGLRVAYDALVEDCWPFPALKEVLLQGKEELERALQQFASPIIVVVSMGMLKAGKSTLTNLMARTPDASPVGFGVDTTLRPALIQMAKEGEEPALCLFFDDGEMGAEEPPEPGTGRRTRQMSLVLDRLRGLEREPSEGLQLSEHRYPLSQENLRKALCSPVGSNALLHADPLLVVVRVPWHPDARMLRHNRMLMDMPGLDSNNSGLRLEQYKAVINECDMMLFVQSSVAPLNKQACQYLKEISAVRQAATTWIILNRMKSRPWLREEVLQQADERQLRHAQDTVCMESGQAPHAHHWASANLGMAYDALLGRAEERQGSITAETLYEESAYQQLEDSLIDDLERNGEATRYYHCCDVLAGCCQQVLENIATYGRGVGERQEKARHKEQLLRELKTLLERELAMRPECIVSGISMEEAPEKLFREEFERVLDREEYSAMKVQGGRVRGSLVDDYLRACSRAGQALALRLLQETPLCQLQVGNIRLDSYCNNELEREWERLQARAAGLFSAAACSDIFGGLGFPVAARVDGEAILDINVREEDFLVPPDVLYGQFELNWSWAFWERHVEVRRDKRGRYAWSDVLEALGRRYAEKVSYTISHRADVMVDRLIQQELERGMMDFQQKLSEALRSVQQEIAALQREQKATDAAMAGLRKTVLSVREMKQNKNRERKRVPYVEKCLCLADPSGVSLVRG